jgi:hypothetical protein
MKLLILSAMTMFSIATFAASTTVKSSAKGDASVTVARVVHLTNLVDKKAGESGSLTNLLVNVVVVDTGGSTDMSPTKKVYLTMYSKGEMFSTDATFEIADIFEFKSAKRVEAGVYEIVVTVPSDVSGLEEVTYIVDGKKASVDIQAVQCDDFDCDASTNFSSSVYVSTK